ncbi:MAG: hypothetical protein RI900_2421 [Actinomycetota bacterium]
MTTPEPYSVPNTTTWLVAGDGAEYRAVLSLPPGRAATPAGLLVLVDGNALQLTAAEFGRVVTRTTMGALPPVAVLGVTCETANHLDYVSSRFRDLTPIPWELPGPFAPDMAMVRNGSGGAGRFLDLLVDSVLPMVRQQVEVDPGRVAIGGWSLGGLFATWSWLQRPDVFSRLLAISPSLWWADAQLVHAPVAERPPDHRAFVCVGEHEEGDIDLVWPRVFANAAQREVAAMVRNAVTFGERLSALGVATDTVVFDAEHHMTVSPAALARGIMHLFA